MNPLPLLPSAPSAHPFIEYRPDAEHETAGELELFPVSSGRDTLQSFFAAYYTGLTASGTLDAFFADPSDEHAAVLTDTMYDVIHDVAPEGSHFALMSSGGKDSSKAVDAYIRSVARRIEQGKRYVAGTVLMGSSGHEFSAMARRQENELAALNKWGKEKGIRAEIVSPRTRDTVLVELIGNGFALPPKASNNTVARASISNWCVDRVKRKLLDASTERAAGLAPFVIQVFGSRYSESESRAFRMRKYSDGLPPGLTRVKLTDKSQDRVVIGFHAIGHYTDTHIRNFVHRDISIYRPLDGNLELEQIYRDASGPDGEATECSISRTTDGAFAGGCSNLATGSRLGCEVCLKATNLALKHLAQRYPTRYRRMYQLQQEINRHQELVHARPRAVIASGLTQETMFPKGFTFLTRYRWLVMVLAAELESGEKRLTEEQLQWIERRWRRHGVVTVTVEDARRDAALWMRIGGEEPPVFFRQYSDFASEFTESLGEGMPMGAYLSYHDEDQGELNLAHLIGFGMTGAPVFPQVMTYVFHDKVQRHLTWCMVTDTPSIIGTSTNTGLLNGMVGASLECRAVRPATYWESQLADGRHMFYAYDRRKVEAQAPRFPELRQSAGDEYTWKLEDFCAASRRKRGMTDEERDKSERLHSRLFLSFLITALENSDARGCGVDFDPVTDHYFRTATIGHLAGHITREQLKAGIQLIRELVISSEFLQHTTRNAHRALMHDLKQTVQNEWSLLAQDNERGSAIRAQIRTRLKEELFNNEERNEEFERYLVLLRDLAHSYTEGWMNTALATRLAFIVRTEPICEEHAMEYMSKLLKLLRVAYN